MRLVSVNVRGYRGIADSTLVDLGNFNILIGKNNSGKTSLMSAINAFFRSLREGVVVSVGPPTGPPTGPPIGFPLDYYRRSPNKAIDITIEFSLDATERQRLVEGISRDAPQMRNAAETFPLDAFLSATVTIRSSGTSASAQPFSCLTRLSIHGESMNNTARGTEQPLLSIGEPAAQELLQRFTGARQKRQDSTLLQEFLGRFDEDDWRRMRPDSGRPPTERLQLRYYLNARLATNVSSEVILSLEVALREVPSYVDFRSQVSSLVSRALDEARLAEEDPLRSRIQTFAGEETGIPQYVSELLGAISAMKVLFLTDRRQPIGREEAARLLSLKMRRGGTPTLTTIQQTVANLLGVRIDAFEGEARSPGERGIAEMDVDDFLAEANGSGIREALRVILDVEFQQPNIVLVEEPEIHLHPALETSIMRYLENISERCQVFISTHSTNFLDTADMSNVYLISKPDSVQAQKLDFQEAADYLPRELGLKLSSLFLFDRLVLVEGPTDEAVIRAWAGALNVNLGGANVGFIPIGGVRNFRYFAAEAVLSFLAKRRARLWFLVDRDERDEDDVRKLQAQTGDRATLVVLNQRELENYLVGPRALIEFIQLKLRLVGKTGNHNIAEAQISKDIQECAQALKLWVVAKNAAKVLCKPIYFTPGFPTDCQDIAEFKKLTKIELEKGGASTSKSMVEIDAVFERQQDLVERRWTTEKLRVVPGDILLDMICQRYGVRFKKESDAPRLAALMNSSEIFPEIASLIRDIGQ